ncbi:hypothetical protein DMY87_22940 [Rhizobium wuzhouense]|uniref:Uncharacterized protein n=2 Tax=Rhizobium wuzhouense TaxID=1986026 RepID=A0ABX5NK87_9HYPH|nr:hypothetical protein DMY87_22940 [Rhizobium wuzhouense]
MIAVVCLLVGCGAAQAAMECEPRMPPYRPGPVEDRLGERPCPAALLATFFARQPPPQEYGFEIVGYHRYRNPDDGSPEAVVEFRLLPPGGHGFGPDLRVCERPNAAADMQIQFTYDKDTQRWFDLDSRGATIPSEICETRNYWTAQDIADFADPPQFGRLSAAERGNVHDVGKGAERRAILDAVREANADLNDRIPIVFVVELLRSDGEHAFFRGQVRMRNGGGPVSATDWGECEQDPRDGVVEALLERRHGRWRALKSNRCADDVLLNNDEMQRYRLLLMEE